MRKTLLVFLTISTAATLAFAATELARVNNKVITLEKFNADYKENAKFFQFKTPSKKNILDDMINREVGIQEAKKLNLDKDPAIVEKMNTVLYQSLIERKLGPKFEAIQLSDKEVEDFYKRNPEIRTSHIFVQLRYDANAAQQKAAFDRIRKLQTDLQAALKSGKTFAEFAMTNSEGVAAASGGDIDYQTKDKLDPAYYAAAVKLSEGGTSDVVRSQFGYHIIRLTGTKSFKDTDKGVQKRILFDEKRTKIFDEYMAGIKRNYKISTNPNLIKE